MKKIKIHTSTSFIAKRTEAYALLKYFILAGIVFISFPACKKSNDSLANTAPSNSIVYKSYVVDSVNYTADSILYDVNNDNVNDIKITMQHNSNGGMMYYSGSISGINNNMIFCYIITQPSWTMLALHNNVNNTGSFNWNPACNYSGSTSYTTGSNNWAQGIFTDYFGFKITLNGNNYYGWFHFKYQSLSETGMNLIPDASIKVGQKI